MLFNDFKAVKVVKDIKVLENTAKPHIYRLGIKNEQAHFALHSPFAEYFS